mgnify:FL=1
MGAVVWEKRRSMWADRLLKGKVNFLSRKKTLE